MNKVIIVGAGISGLSLGIFLLNKGYDVHIYEKNKYVGGCCSGWYRNDTYIDNCIHWLTGTNQHTLNFKLWKEIGALDEKTNLYQADYFYKSHLGNQSIALYYDLEKTRTEMYNISTEDKNQIDKFIDCTKKVCNSLINNGKCKNTFNKIKGYIKLYMKYNNVSLEDLSNSFKHPLLKKVFIDYFPKCYSSFALIVSYATFASGNGKMYCDGSLSFSNKISQKFRELKGNLHLEKPITNVLLEGNNISYVLSNNEVIKGDYYIFAIDPFYLFNNLIPIDYMPKELYKKYMNEDEYITTSSYQAAYLTNNSLDNMIKDTEIISISTNNIINNINDNSNTDINNKLYNDEKIDSIEIGNKKISRIIVKEYSYLSKLSNHSDKIIQIMIPQHKSDYDYWSYLYQVDANLYNREKDKIALKIKDFLQNKYKIELSLLDSWTPLTYNQYCNLYNGSYMGFTYTKDSKIKKIPYTIKGIDNMYICTIWQDMTGGLPIALNIAKKLSNKYF